jgi:hypothetical protein
MQPWELELLKEKTGLFALDLAAWTQEEWEGHPAYRTQIDNCDVAVWRGEQGEIAWTTLHPVWMPENQIDQLHELLKARGFTGARHDDYTKHHMVIFQQGELQLVVRASRAEPKTRKQLEAKADVFMDDLYWKSKGWE